ncbi:MAG: class I tRNA ligase family protein [Faecalimonas sp.]
MTKKTLSTLAVLLAPFAPHIAEEIWEQLGHVQKPYSMQDGRHYDEVTDER